ncbi:MAG TPA: hypothetical protein VIK86_05705 [Candidatus Paceibacterota bacterium]
MNESKKVFINFNGEVNTRYKGRLANISDLENAICEGYEPITGILELEDGTYIWQSEEDLKKILMQDKDIIQEELDEIIGGEYIKIDDKVNPLYTELVNNIDPVVEEIVSVNFCEGLLTAITKCRNEDWSYLHNYSYSDLDNKEIIIMSVQIPVYLIRASLNIEA